MDLWVKIAVGIFTVASLAALFYIAFIVVVDPRQFIHVAPERLQDPCPIGACIRASKEAECQVNAKGQVSCQLPSDFHYSYLAKKNLLLLSREEELCPSVSTKFCLRNPNDPKECTVCHNLKESLFECPLAPGDLVQDGIFYFTPSYYATIETQACIPLVYSR